MNVDELLQTVSDPLMEMTHGDAVLGTPVKLGTVTVIPISRISVGLGGGGGTGEGEAKDAKHGRMAGSGTGEGGGAAARIRPVALLALTSQGARVLPIPGKQGTLDKVLEKIPALIERFGPKS